MSTTCCHFGMSQKLRKWLRVDSKPNTHHLDMGETTHLRTMDLNKPKDTSWVWTLQADGRWHNSPLPVSIRGSNILFLCTANVLDTIPGRDVTVILLCPFSDVLFPIYLDDHCGMCVVEKLWCNNFDSNNVIPVVPQRGSTKTKALYFSLQSIFGIFPPAQDPYWIEWKWYDSQAFCRFWMSEVGWVGMDGLDELVGGWMRLRFARKDEDCWRLFGAKCHGGGPMVGSIFGSVWFFRRRGGEVASAFECFQQPCGRLAWNRRKRRRRRQQRRRNGSVFGRRSDTWKKFFSWSYLELSAMQEWKYPFQGSVLYHCHAFFTYHSHLCYQATFCFFPHPFRLEIIHLILQLT